MSLGTPDSTVPVAWHERIHLYLSFLRYPNRRGKGQGAPRRSRFQTWARNLPCELEKGLVRLQRRLMSALLKRIGGIYF